MEITLKASIFGLMSSSREATFCLHESRSRQLIHQSSNSFNRSTKESISQINQSINQSTKQIDQHNQIDQIKSIVRSINQSKQINQSRNRPINQSLNQAIKSSQVRSDQITSDRRSCQLKTKQSNAHLKQSK